jgi:hypothetical protein
MPGNGTRLRQRAERVDVPGEKAPVCRAIDEQAGKTLEVRAGRTVDVDIAVPMKGSLTAGGVLSNGGSARLNACALSLGVSGQTYGLLIPKLQAP